MFGIKNSFFPKDKFKSAAMIRHALNEKKKRRKKNKRARISRKINKKVKDGKQIKLSSYRKIK